MKRMARHRVCEGLVLVISILAGCTGRESSVSAPANDQPQVESQATVEASIAASRRNMTALKARDGSMVPEAAMRATLDTLVRELASVLQDPAARKELLSALHASPYREHKIHVKDFLGRDARTIPARLASRGLSGSTLGALLERMRDLELYVPDRGHFASWAGGDNLVVVGSLREHDEVFGYTLSGDRFVVPEGDVPSTPALAVVNTETDFSKRPMPTDCDPTVFICSGEGSGDNGPPPTPIPGVYLTEMTLYDLHEGWPRGDPEIEVCLISRDGLNMKQSGRCANQGGSDSAAATGVRVFDQNSSTWVSPYFGVLVASLAELQAIAIHDGTPIDSTTWMLQVWEDDTERGVIHDEDKEYELVSSTIQAAGGIGLWVKLNPLFSNHQECVPLYVDPPQYCLIFQAARVWAALNIIEGLAHLPSAAWNLLTGANDDLVGVMVDANQAYQHAGITSSHNYVVMRGATKAGEANITYVP